MVTLTFSPKTDVQQDATKEYQAIWLQDGERIVSVLQTVTGLTFKETAIAVIVYEGPSFSGGDRQPMRLRASYEEAVKQGTLVHELGHRLLAVLEKRIEGIDEHRSLNLFLYDAWVELYGREFADRLVAVESGRTGIYDYAAAWDWFGTLSTVEKKDHWEKLLTLNGIKSNMRV